MEYIRPNVSFLFLPGSNSQTKKGDVCYPKSKKRIYKRNPDRLITDDVVLCKEYSQLQWQLTEKMKIHCV